MGEPELRRGAESEAGERCPACGATTAATVFGLQSSRGQGAWTRCPACGSYFLLEAYDVAGEAAHTATRPWGRPETGRELGVFKRRMFRAVLDLLRAHRPPPARLLDVGCSYGGFLLEARRRGYAVSGMDILPDAVAAVQELGMVARVAASVGHLTDVPAGSLDVVTCLDCNYYWPDQPEELRRLRTTLRPHGLLAMRVVTKVWMLRLGLALGTFLPGLAARVKHTAVNDHRFSMPLPSLLRVVRTSGFDVLTVSITGALHSERSRLPVKLAFMLGAPIWHLGGIMLAPGALVLARRRET
jgi:SAM-dependent methyltransferase